MKQKPDVNLIIHLEMLTYYDAAQCRGVCGCLKADYISEKARCGKFGGIKYFSEVTCTATCGSCQDLFKKSQKGM